SRRAATLPQSVGYILGFAPPAPPSPDGAICPGPRGLVLGSANVPIGIGRWGVEPGSRAPSGADEVLPHVGHVEEVLLEVEPPPAGVAKQRDAGLLVGPTVLPCPREDLPPDGDDVIALDGGEEDGEPPVLEPRHALDEELG